jgi:uncharacterized protein (TIGR02145 family)
MKKLFFGLAVFTVLQLNAQNYEITFTGTGGSTSVATVKVENLTSGTTATLAGTDILNLTIATGENSPSADQSSGLKLYPNPMTDYSILEILPPVKGEAVITICEMTGKTVVTEKADLEKDGQNFKLSGFKNGLFLVTVKGDGFQFSGKLVSNGNANGGISIEKTGYRVQATAENEVKTARSIASTINMAYKTGEILKFTGASGNYKTIVTDVPVASKIINFNFVACQDGDYYIYPVVTISTQSGTQTWIAENLKTITYNDHTAITNVTDPTEWSTNTTGAYCNYLNAPTYSTIYGRLYNWYVVSPTNPKNVCPTGWHVATDAEWTTLTTYLGGAGVAGSKLKESGTNNWLNPNVATNETGFTARPGGYRSQDGTDGLAGTYGFWWTSTSGGTSFAYYRYMINSDGGIGVGDNDKHTGSYIRCLKN